MAENRVYLDNCCFNRPFDDQRQIRIRIEAEAKLRIQALVKSRDIELCWSYMLDLENTANPFDVRRKIIGAWRFHATIDIEESAAIVAKANQLEQSGLKAKDALHVACAVAANCTHFITTDDAIVRRGSNLQDITIVDPVDFIRDMHL